jgi:DNA-binding winged helix-turn-helix (wHTH) protein
MERLRAFGAARAVLFAVSRREVFDLARLFANAGFAPMLAFERAQIIDFARFSDLVVADDRVDPDGVALQQAGSPQDTIRIFVTEPHRPAPADVHALVPPDLPPHELLARAQSLLTLRGDRAHTEVLTWGPLRLDLGRRETHWRGGRCSLTQTQFDILVALVQAGGAVVSKTELQKAIWPDDPPDAGERLVAHVRRIRSRIEDDPSHLSFLLTSRGIGFCLADPDELDRAERAPARLRRVEPDSA